MTNQELTATFLYERHVFLNDGGATRVIIGDVQVADDEMFTVKGEAQDGQLKQGLDYRFYGKWVDHHKHGRQFVFKSFVLEEPAGQRAVTVYLQQCNGIGYVVASRLWKQYGNEAVKRLRESPEAVAAEVKGLSEEKAVAASEFLGRSIASERAKMDLLEALSGRGFPKKVLELVLHDFGSIAAKAVTHNPYLLMRYPGVGFLTCDKMYLDLKKPASRLKRQALCGWYALAKDSSGDTWISARRVVDGIEREISGSDLRVDAAIELSVRGKLLVPVVHHGSRLFALRARDRQEGNVARIVAGVLCEKHAELPWPHDTHLNVSEHQRAAYKLATTGRFGILGGGPGTGKTHTTAEIIKALLKSGWRADAIGIAAPTGKAAVRITEAMQIAGVPLQAKTIHSMLGVESAGDGGWSFTHGPDLPLPFKFVFVDEVSMLDCSLASSFFSAIAPDTNVLLVGDVNQLPPVGHGAPLRDLIAAGVPYGELTEIRRNSGRIVQACAEIREKRRFTASEKLDLENGENLLHIEKPDAESQIEMLDYLLGEFKKGEEYNEIWDVQVLVPLNKRGPLSRKALNQRMQLILNGSGIRAAGNPFRVRDKIICTKNGWFPAVDTTAEGVNEDGKLYVANGEQAEVCEVEPRRTVAKLSNPDRLIVIPKGESDAEDGGDDSGDGDSESNSTGTGCNWELGYAISVHKSQGSEWPVCIVVCDDSSAAKMVQSRNWFYTAISRAKKFCITVGQAEVIRGMMARDGMRRMTLLAERVGEEVDAIERRRVAEAVKKWDWGEVFDGVLIEEGV